MSALRVLSLFTGIGGIDLGLQRAGMTIAGQVEIDPWCRTILEKHWPEVPRHDDVRTAAEWWLGLVADTDSAGRQQQRRPGTVPASQPAAERCGWCCVKNSPPAWATHLPRFDACYCTQPRPAVDLVCGGFPCQPVSQAGRGKAQADSRWLWPPFAQVIRHLRPRFVLVENVPGLLDPVRVKDDDGRFLGYAPAPIEEVVGDLAALGYDAEWDCIPAAFVGAPHIRNRVWIVAYPQRDARDAWRASDASEGPRGRHADRGTVGADVADAARFRGGQSRQRTVDGGTGSRGAERFGTVGAETVADVDGRRLPQLAERYSEPQPWIFTPFGHDSQRRDPHDPHADSSPRSSPRRPGQTVFRPEQVERPGRLRGGIPDADGEPAGRPAEPRSERGQWVAEPDVGRVAHGIPRRVDRLRGLGNAVVPQVVEHIGRLIIEADAAR